MRRTLIPVLLLALLAAVLAAGCGGGGKEASGTTTAGTVERTTTSTETTATEPTTTGVNLGLSKSCRDLGQLMIQLQQVLTGTFTAEDLQATQKLLDTYVQTAPEEIRDDIRVYDDYWTKIVDALKGVDLTSPTAVTPEVQERLRKAESQIDAAKLERAGRNVTAWAQKNCTG